MSTQNSSSKAVRELTPGAGEMLTSYGHWLPLQRIWVCFSVPTWQLRTACNFSSTGSNQHPLLTSEDSCTHVVCRHMLRLMRIQTNRQTDIFKKRMYSGDKYKLSWLKKSNLSHLKYHVTNGDGFIHSFVHSFIH